MTTTAASIEQAYTRPSCLEPEPFDHTNTVEGVDVSFDCCISLVDRTIAYAMTHYGNLMRRLAE